MPGWTRIFGPVLLYDMVRTARRPHVFVVRGVFALCLLLGLFKVWASAIRYESPSLGALVSTTPLSAGVLADLNCQVFVTIMGLQLAAAFVLTPAYTGGAIANEKERGTLEFLLSTDLTSGEIVLGLLGSRLANLALVFLTSLGILAPLQILGGIEPGLLLAGYAAIGLTVLSLAGLGVLNSVHSRRFHQGIARTYLVAFGYLALTTGAKLLLTPRISRLPSTSKWTWSIEVVNWLCAGNIVTAAMDLKKALSSGTPLHALLPSALGHYACFHLLAPASCTGLAILRLRTVAVKEMAGTSRAMAQPLPRWPWFQMGTWPMLWKEIVKAPGRRRGLAAHLGIGLLVMSSFIPAAYFLYHYHLRKYPLGHWDRLHTPIYSWVRHATNSMSCLMLLQVTVRAAGSISGERDRRTLEPLRTTLLNASEILFAKWLGSILSVRWTWCWLGAIWLTAYLLGGLAARAVPQLILAWLVFAGFQAILGLWFSTTSRSSQRAIFATLLTSVILWGSHWLFWLTFGPLFHWSHHHHRHVVRFFQEYGLTPPMALTRLTHVVLDPRLASGGNGLVWLGISLWGLAGVTIWCWASCWFHRAGPPIHARSS